MEWRILSTGILPQSMSKLLFVAFAFSMALLSCSSDDEGLASGMESGSGTVSAEGGGASIGLSDSVISLKCGRDTAIVTAEKGGWSIDSVIVDGVPYAFSDAGTKAFAEQEWAGGTFGWLTVMHSDRRIMVAAERNLWLPRTFEILIAAGDSIVRLPGTQGEQEILPDGLWGDVIGLAPNAVLIDAVGGTQLAITVGGHWTIESVTVDGETTLTTLAERERCAEEREFGKTVNWLTVSRNRQELIVEALPNDSADSRRFEVRLSSGNYFTKLTGWQAGTYGLPDGISHDAVCLSPRTLVLSAAGDVQQATTQSDHWWLAEVRIDGEAYGFSAADGEPCADGSDFTKTIGWLTLTRSGRQVTVEAAPNRTGGMRKFTAVLAAGNYHCTLTGYQAYYMSDAMDASHAPR